MKHLHPQVANERVCACGHQFFSNLKYFSHTNVKGLAMPLHLTYQMVRHQKLIKVALQTIFNDGISD